ncbi:hypothetical protein CJ739_988 [Mariniflexile rhizosphaerae]|uniref:RHS repeat domain-containing protein n=1 Tax=unclassified Mariniflexile TaxID=2643887 RepID=UPI000CB01C5A|nr:RHS repeat domain-containing protein [Mariniflexile sp. TRM1-10]AXP80081.1 hypothetical protein CJ739_988 [Mariniflexile sp. TRM1-10]PLB20913.1 MAG: YD repeat protein [Flavobacteriaceae bacterium FS1-H7996/R]
MRQQILNSYLVFTVTLLVVAAWPGSLHAQDPYPEVPTYVTPSPDASAFTRYGDYPVNYNTGMVDMRVPIYTIKSGSLTVPIDISFHASGRMSTEYNGILGLRWVLNVGGVITRELRGYPDEWDELSPYNVPQNPQITSGWVDSNWLTSQWNQQDWTEGTWLYNLLYPSQSAGVPEFEELYKANPQTNYYWNGSKSNIGIDRYDSERDIFRYQLPSGKSGKFILKKVNDTLVGFTIPYEPLQFNFVGDPNNDSLFIEIKITDIDGTIYTYGGENANEYDDNDVGYSRYPLPESFFVAWYLKEITSADKQDTIQLDYALQSKGNGSHRETITVCDRLRNATEVTFLDEESQMFIPYSQTRFEVFPGKIVKDFDSNLNLHVPLLNSITFKHGEANFSYIDHSVPYGVGGMIPILDEITISSDSNDKKFRFDIQVEPGDYNLHLLGLDYISMVNSSEIIEKEYSFEYYGLTNPNSGSFGTLKDWWGYFNNNVYSNYDELFYYPNVLYDGQMYYGNVDLGSSSMSNTSSNNDYRDPDFNSLVFGMLKTINYPTGGSTGFEYENNYYDEQGVKTKGPGLRISKITNKPNQGENNVRIFRYGQLDINGVETGIGHINPLLKPYVNTVQESSVMHYWDYEHVGYRVRTFSSDPLDNFGSSVIHYDKVTEYSSDDPNKAWKTEYEYSQKYFDVSNYNIDDKEKPIEYQRQFYNPYREWAGGKLLKKNTFNSANDTITKESYNYKIKPFDYLWDMPTYRHVIFSLDLANQPFSRNLSEWFDEEKRYHEQSCTVIGYGYRGYFSGSENLFSKTVEHFDGDGIVVTSEYTYDSQYNQIKTEETTNSNGKVSRLEYEYPFDNPTVPINSKMVGLNMVGVPLTKSQYINKNGSDVFLQNSRTLYGEWSPTSNNWNIDSNLDVDIIRPRTQYFKKGNTTEEPIIEFHSYYNNGKMKEVSKTDGIHTVYVWGYNEEYPIAKIDNATFISNQPSTITSNQQTLINNAITAATNETTDITEDNLRAKLQLLREGFPNAMVTTYTYDPLVGVTSIIDPKGHTVYYGYDDFDRLKQVKDASGNILNENEYNYKQ